MSFLKYLKTSSRLAWEGDNWREEGKKIVFEIFISLDCKSSRKFYKQLNERIVSQWDKINLRGQLDDLLRHVSNQ